TAGGLARWRGLRLRHRTGLRSVRWRGECGRWLAARDPGRRGTPLGPRGARPRRAVSAGEGADCSAGLRGGAMTESTVEFRERVRSWLAENLPASLVGVGGPGREHEHVPERLAWERTLAAGGWIGLGWESPYGGRADIERQVIFFEEYARAGGPGRLS